MTRCLNPSSPTSGVHAWKRLWAHQTLTLTLTYVAFPVDPTYLSVVVGVTFMAYPLRDRLG